MWRRWRFLGEKKWSFCSVKGWTMKQCCAALSSGWEFIPTHTQGTDFSHLQSGPIHSEENVYNNVSSEFCLGWLLEALHYYCLLSFFPPFSSSPLILEAQGDKWVTPCSLVNRQTGSWWVSFLPTYMLLCSSAWCETHTHVHAHSYF